MGKIIDIPRGRGKKKGRRSRNIKAPVKLGVTAVGFVTVIIVCVLALFYLIQANRTATYGFEIEKYDGLITELRKERSKLELEAAKLRSTNKIKEKLEELNMQEIDPTKISYYEVKKHLAVEKE